MTAPTAPTGPKTRVTSAPATPPVRRRVTPHGERLARCVASRQQTKQTGYEKKLGIDLCYQPPRHHRLFDHRKRRARARTRTRTWAWRVSQFHGGNRSGSRDRRAVRARAGGLSGTLKSWRSAGGPPACSIDPSFEIGGRAHPPSGVTGCALTSSSEARTRLEKTPHFFVPRGFSARARSLFRRAALVGQASLPASSRGIPARVPGPAAPPRGTGGKDAARPARLEA